MRGVDIEKEKREIGGMKDVEGVRVLDSEESSKKGKGEMERRKVRSWEGKKMRQREQGNGEREPTLRKKKKNKEEKEERTKKNEK